jgi:hypothetical protein
MFKCDDNIAVKCKGGDETTGMHPILIGCGIVGAGAASWKNNARIDGGIKNSKK